MTTGTKLALAAALFGLTAPAFANHHEKKTDAMATDAMAHDAMSPEAMAKMTPAEKKKHDAMMKKHDAMMKKDAMAADKMAAPK